MKNAVIHSAPEGDFIIVNEDNAIRGYTPQLMVTRLNGGGAALSISTDQHGSKTIVLDKQHASIVAAHMEGRKPNG